MKFCIIVAVSGLFILQNVQNKAKFILIETAVTENWRGSKHRSGRAPDDDYKKTLGNCTFTHHCLGNRSPCENLADATCVCSFGQCLVRGRDRGMWIPGVKATAKQCSTYKDCPCRDNTDKCFCIEEQCVNEAMECHDNNDCSKLEKCDGKQCICTGGTCEWQCETTEDCINNNDAFNCQVFSWVCNCTLGHCWSV